MGLEVQVEGQQNASHACPLPWPVDPHSPEGHVCACGRRWIYEPAHWNPLYTLAELRIKQETGEFARGIVPHYG
jgi:hypothetical protein